MKIQETPINLSYDILVLEFWPKSMYEN